ncbi:Vesicle-fusing ATPase 1 [Camellia lanceoleosa]|uniref:Vesicle-fusing ATPase 1 n=1 Tax=Camellia lanceoleosa TaxID=1840588 RepID=A0ACC0HQW8_9ERIC|nr:Vesicle-fusing ATPase 1 [Camellia lanceoleosa]
MCSAGGVNPEGLDVGDLRIEWMKIKAHLCRAPSVPSSSSAYQRSDLSFNSVPLRLGEGVYVSICLTDGSSFSSKEIIHGPDVLNAFQGVSERKIRSLFEAVKKDENRYGAKSDLHIIIFDEIDSIAKKRGVAMGQHHMDDRLVNQLLTMVNISHISLFNFSFLLFFLD